MFHRRLTSILLHLAFAASVATTAWSGYSQGFEPARIGAGITTVVVSAEGLLDPYQNAYVDNEPAIKEAVIQNALQRCAMKAAAIYVERTKLLGHYDAIRKQFKANTGHYVSQIVRTSEMWHGKDELIHILVRAEVNIGNVLNTLQEISAAQRVNLIKEYGNPRISVAITLRDADRGSDTPPQPSQLAENIVIASLTNYGYRVWSANGGTGTSSRSLSADFSIQGDAKLKTLRSPSPTGFTEVTKYALTSLTIRCVNNHTGEVVTPVSAVPKQRTWADEDQALEEIGHFVAGTFGQQFFEQQLMRPSRICQLEITGLPNLDAGMLLKRELIGINSVLNVDFQNFEASGASYFEIEFAGGNEDLAALLHADVAESLNQKFDDYAFMVVGARGETVQMRVKDGIDTSKFENRASLAINEMPPNEIEDIVKSTKVCGGILEAGGLSQRIRDVIDAACSIAGSGLVWDVAKLALFTMRKAIFRF